VFFGVINLSTNRLIDYLIISYAAKFGAKVKFHLMLGEVAFIPVPAVQFDNFLTDKTGLFLEAHFNFQGKRLNLVLKGRPAESPAIWPQY
jgi:hypothetical protein